jgi:hypothetical protein
MAVDIADHMPAVGLEAGRVVVPEPAVHVAVDGDAVAVEEGDKLAQSQCAGERTGFMRDTFHQATVTDGDIGKMIDNVIPGPVIGGRQGAFRQCHADGVGQALAERSGGRFDSRGITVLGMPRCF